MSETNFPKRMRLTQISDLYFNYYWETEVNEWLMRMVKDFPKTRNVGWGIGGEEEYDEDIYDTDDVEAWREKWLSQFTTDSELTSDMEDDSE